MSKNVLVKDHLRVIQRHSFEWQCPKCEEVNRVIRDGGGTKYLQCSKCEAEIKEEGGNWGIV